MILRTTTTAVSTQLENLNFFYFSARHEDPWRDEKQI